MRRPSFVLLLALATAPGMIEAASCDCGHASCTGAGGCPECVPACTATWDEKKTKKPKYSLKCEYACVRGFDPWHAPPPECRCHPPCGDVIVKKRLYKADGKETVERVPKYEVRMVPAEPCGCAACRRHEAACWWRPLATLGGLLPW
ncbi:MAG: hypothetical protein EBZ74_08290 [Planctomycetia bacterium]|nr:hypothetical protein [Planctomycetia bacterium]